MTADRVSSPRVPYLPITVEIPEEGLTARVTALMDTGFNSDVILPEGMVAHDRPALLMNEIRLADDSLITVPGYLGNVRIGGTTIGPVIVFVMGMEPIIGLSVITQFRVTIDHDRSVTVEP